VLVCFIVCVQSKVSFVDMRVHSTFERTLEVRAIKFTPEDPRFYYVPARNSPVFLNAGHESSVCSVMFLVVDHVEKK